MISGLFEKVHSSQKGFFLSLLRSLLYSISLFYRLVVHLRNRLYESYLHFGEKHIHRLFKIKVSEPRATVISVGNIVAGGTGKTPFTILMAKEILKRGQKLAILSRGYRSELEKSKEGPHLISGKEGPKVSAQECGDEPYLMCQKVPEALFFVGKNRVQAAQQAERHGAKIILLDDGMQYRKLGRHFDITLLDALDPFGKHHFLPRGLLREHPAALKRSSLVVINHCQNQAQFNFLKDNLKKITQAPIVGMTPLYQETVDYCNGANLDLKGKKILAFCAIAKPHHFFKLIESQGAEVVSKKVLPDHQRPSLNFLKMIMQEAKAIGADLVLCTEKDAVKLPKNMPQSVPIGVLKMELSVEYGKKEFEEVIEKMITTALIN